MNIPAHQLRVTLEQRVNPGGQHCGLEVPGVMVEHIPSGLAAVCRYARSQLKNKTIATEMIEYGLLALGWKQDEIDRITPEAMKEFGGGLHPSRAFPEQKSECPKPAPNHPQEYEPEFWSVRKDDIYAASYALETGLEHTRGALVEHDTNLGRTIPKNKSWAEQLERDIATIEDAIKRLRRPEIPS